MPWMVGLAAGGLLASGIGSAMAAGAAGDIAEAQLAEARRNRELAMGFAAPSANDLESLSRQNSLAQQSVQYQQQQMAMLYQQMAVVDPAIRMAFEQQGDILKGKIPSYLSPLQNQLNIDKQNQSNRINTMMGRGADTSSAGIMANAAYSQQNAMTLMNAQQQALGVLGQVGSNAIGAQQGLQGGAMNAFNLANASNAQAFGMSDTLAKRQMNAIFGTPTTQYAGAGSVGGLMLAQGLQGMGNQAFGTGLGMASSMGMMSQYKDMFPGAAPGAVPSGRVSGQAWGPSWTPAQAAA
jgi:hypothetical protein